MLEVPDKKTDTSFLLFAKEITADLSTGLMTIESTEETQTETDYKSATNKDKRKKTEAKVNKLEGKITLLTQESSEHEEKIAQQEIEIDSIKQNVGDIIDYKREVDGTTEIHLIDSGNQKILKLEIQGNKTYESNLYPAEDLYPSEDLYPNQEVL